MFVWFCQAYMNSSEVNEWICFLLHTMIETTLWVTAMYKNHNTLSSLSHFEFELEHIDRWEWLEVGCKRTITLASPILEFYITGSQRIAFYFDKTLLKLTVVYAVNVHGAYCQEFLLDRFLQEWWHFINLNFILSLARVQLLFAWSDLNETKYKISTSNRTRAYCQNFNLDWLHKFHE